MTFGVPTSSLSPVAHCAATSNQSVMTRHSLEHSLATLQSDEIGRMLLASIDTAAIAATVAERDPYGEMGKLVAAAALVGSDVDPGMWLMHRLWCAQRRAQGQHRPALAVRVEGGGYLRETTGYATVLVSPMTLDTADALSVIEQIFTDRSLVVFGEGMTQRDAGDARVVVAMAGHEIRQIIGVLARGGVYCTYGDFAYSGRASIQTSLFGVTRAMPRGWVRIAARNDTMLLPLVIVRDGAASTVVKIREPVIVRGTGELSLIADFLARQIEQGIECARAQWLLLPTLTYEVTRQA
jgi:hypothetical protein